MEKFIRVAFVAGGAALAGGALGAFSVERDLLKERAKNKALQLDLQITDERYQRLISQEKQQQRNLADLHSASMAQQWMRHQGMSEYEAEWRKAVTGPLVEKAMHALLANNRWGKFIVCVWGWCQFTCVYVQVLTPVKCCKVQM